MLHFTTAGLERMAIILEIISSSMNTMLLLQFALYQLEATLALQVTANISFLHIQRSHALYQTAFLYGRLCPLDLSYN